MYTTIDYLNFRQDISFDALPVNMIDRMIFTCMGKPDFTNVVPEDGPGIRYEDTFENFMKMSDEQTEPGLLESPQFRVLMPIIAHSKRYSDVIVSNFVRKIVTEKTEQFSALTVDGPDGFMYVTFRGTDDTLIGWKENCELAIQNEVAAQRDALAYLNKIASLSSRPLLVTGHSKGGNLAVYAASMAEPDVQKRIRGVYSYDGPGFSKEFFEREGYKRIAKRVMTIVPKSSYVGMMMNHAGELRVVDCAKEGLAAHDTYIWGLNPNAFVIAEQTNKSKSFKTTFNELIDRMSPEEKQKFTNDMFEILSSTGAKSLNELSDQSYKQLLQMALGFKDAKEIQKFIISLSGKSFVENISLKLDLNKD